MRERPLLGTEIAKLGHEVRLIAPTYVKPFVKRQKNNAADAEAICEAAQRPTMRFVAVKSEAKQASAVVFRTRDLLVGQRTQIINAIRGHLAEYGLIAPQGPSHVDQLIAQIEDPAPAFPIRHGHAWLFSSRRCGRYRARSRRWILRSPPAPNATTAPAGS